MDEKTPDVLDAADKRLAAVEAVTAADEAQHGRNSEQATLDAAEVELATSVMVWRDADRPD